MRRAFAQSSSSRILGGNSRTAKEIRWDKREDYGPVVDGSKLEGIAATEILSGPDD